MVAGRRHQTIDAPPPTLKRVRGVLTVDHRVLTSQASGVARSATVSRAAAGNGVAPPDNCQSLTEADIVARVPVAPLAQPETTTWPAPTPIGLRERKKRATRDALLHAAVSLFEQRGVEATTVDDIADLVGVSPRTFHRYFASKEDVLFADSEQRRERFRAALADRPASEPLLDSLREVVHDVTARVIENAGLERSRQNLLRNETSLKAARLAQTAQWHQVVAEHAAVRLGIGADDPLAVLLGACTSWVMRTAIEHWLESPESDPSTTVDQCFDLLADLRAATQTRRAGVRSRQAPKVVRR